MTLNRPIISFINKDSSLKHQVRVFRCPRCREFTASDAKSCRFCHIPIDLQAMQIAIDAQEKENKLYRRKHYVRHMLIGGGLFTLWLIFTASAYSIGGLIHEFGHYVITHGLILTGVGDFLYGLVGWLGELK